MSVPFSRTLRALSAETARRDLAALAAGATLLLAWSAWFVLAPVSVYATAAEARVEAPVHRVEASVGGTVREAPLEVGASVAEGDLLVALDDEVELIALERARALEVSTGAQLDALLAQAEAREGARGATDEAGTAGRAEARSRWEAAEAAASSAEEEMRRTRALAEQGQAIAGAEVQLAEARARELRADAEAARQAWSRTGAEVRAAAGDRSAESSALDAEIARLRGDAERVRGEVASLEEAISRLRIVSPVDGRLAEAAALRAGAVLEVGDLVASVVPDVEPQAVGWFLPGDAVGRITPGQPALMRLDGFSWTRYGALHATVTRVGTEPRDGRVRVELAVDAERFAVPVEHGLTGTLEVEVERTSPASLVIRSAGGFVQGRR